MSLTRDAFDNLVQTDPDALYALYQQQEAQVAALAARVQQLEAQLGQHSQNSHRPPSSDGARKPPRSQRTRSGRRPGGQRGHPGQTLEMTATPDEVVDHYPPQCPSGGATLTAVAATTVQRRQ